MPLEKSPSFDPLSASPFIPAKFALDFKNPVSLPDPSPLPLPAGWRREFVSRPPTCAPPGVSGPGGGVTPAGTLGAGGGGGVWPGGGVFLENEGSKPGHLGSVLLAVPIHLLFCLSSWIPC